MLVPLVFITLQSAYLQVLSKIPLHYKLETLLFFGMMSSLARLSRHRSGDKDTHRMTCEKKTYGRLCGGRIILFFFHDQGGALTRGCQRCSHLAQACWGPPSGCLLEEILFPTLALGILFFLRALVCGLHGCLSRVNELHLLVEDPYQRGIEIPSHSPGSPVPTLNPNSPHLCLCEHYLCSLGCECIEQAARA